MTDTAHRHLIRIAKKVCKDAHALLQTNGPVELIPRAEADLFGFLARVVSGQQLAKYAAQAIFGRVEAAALAQGCTLYEFVSDRQRSKLAECGLSRNKVKAMIALKDAFEAGTLVANSDTPPTHAEITEAVTSVWGFGPWSADMTAIFYYGLPDVWSELDGSLRKGIEILTGQDWQESLDVVSGFSPYRSFLALHIWKGLDDGVLIADR